MFVALWTKLLPIYFEMFEKKYFRYFQIFIWFISDQPSEIAQKSLPQQVNNIIMSATAISIPVNSSSDFKAHPAEESSENEQTEFTDKNDPEASHHIQRELESSFKADPKIDAGTSASNTDIEYSGMS